MASAVRHAAIIDRDQGAPDDALKLYQLAQFKLLDARGHPGLPAEQASLHVRAAYALALMGRPDDVRRELVRAADLPPIDDRFERADTDAARARAELALGKVDAAEQYGANSVRTWGPDDRRDSAHARITLATTHAVAGEADAPALATTAIDAAAGLRSMWNRAMLVPLETALAARKDSASAELARRARELRVASV
jgi:hypothetical protein